MVWQASEKKTTTTIAIASAPHRAHQLMPFSIYSLKNNNKKVQVQNDDGNHSAKNDKTHNNSNNNEKNSLVKKYGWIWLSAMTKCILHSWLKSFSIIQPMIFSTRVGFKFNQNALICPFVHLACVRSPWDFHICIANAFSPTEIELMLQFWITCCAVPNGLTRFEHSRTHTAMPYQSGVQTINILFASYPFYFILFHAEYSLDCISKLVCRF